VADKKTDTQPAGGSGDEPKPNKMEAMRQTLAALGDKAETARVREHLKERFGVEMTAKMISSYKSDIVKQRAKAAKAPAVKPAAAAEPEAAESAPTAPAPRRAPPAASANGNGAATVRLEDVLAVRGLVDRVGADQLRDLIAAFER
jgi:hypothetical protein